MSSLSPAGLLWQDDDSKKPPEKKVKEAADRYMEKFGGVPDTCYVHPDALGHEGQSMTVSLGNGHEVRVLALPTIAYPIHFWIGEFEIHREDIPVHRNCCCPVNAEPEGPGLLKLKVR